MRAMPHLRLFLGKKKIFNQNTPLHKRYMQGGLFLDSFCEKGTRLQLPLNFFNPAFIQFISGIA